MKIQTGWILFAALVLTACSSTPTRKEETRSSPAPVIESNAVPTISGTQPKRGGYLEGDSPGKDIPANLDSIPDAVPRVEPLHRFANSPYSALGKTYTPLTSPGGYKERGIASWYGKKFHGKRTASGEIYDMYSMSAAHPVLPVPSYARVTNLANKKSVVVRINDRGPFMHDRIIDLSYAAAHKLGIVNNGSAEVVVEVEGLVAENKALPPEDTESVVITPLKSTMDSVVVAPIKPPPAFSAPVAAAKKTSPALVPSALGGELASGNVYLQLGAFRSQQSAESFLSRMNIEFEGSGKRVELYQKDDDMIRIHVGPYLSQEEARATAERLEPRLGFRPLVKFH
ncbi:septal ring lytic transglycosylase RlpA family protein [Candidatus Nitrotoga fabula]|uniref:Endolytic peptidoglycan transglycosylase RlpA n=1 Tax=Candidatus Nitrotoga fabula TaxID=2182327 RepID=A0A916BEC0_9PROT|nr:septal ring lytic transglycosylase RlpA family protein [Candidatus Nitrotoga fabula]CAE6717457.1 Rare lipoprotein A precursor [Candidatus Nitrotoga fabula]